MPRTDFGSGYGKRPPAEADTTTSYLEDLGSTLSKAATDVQGAARAAEAAVPAPVRGAGKAVKFAAAPLLHGLQQFGMRMSAAEANVIEAQRQYVEDVQEGQGPLRPVPKRMTQAFEGIVRGFAESPETGKGRPEGTGAIAPHSEYMRQKYGDFSLLGLLPLQIRKNIFQEMMIVTGGNPKAMKTVAEVLNYATGPGGVGLAMDYASGEGLTKAAGLAGAAARATGLARTVDRSVDAVLRSEKVLPIVSKFSTFAHLPRASRERMRRIVETSVGAGAAAEARLGRLVDGDMNIIEAGAKRYGMTPVERGYFLEQVYERAPASKEGFYFDDLVSRNIITPHEARYLKDGLMELLESSIPATRAGAGLDRWTLYESSYSSARKAKDALRRVENLRQDLTDMTQNEFYRGTELVGGEFKYDKVMAPGIDAKRRELIKALTEADDALRSFRKTSRPTRQPPDLDRENLWRYTTDELLGTVNAQPVRGPYGGVIREAMRRDLDLKADQLPYRAVIRQNESGLPAVRVFDRFGNELMNREAPTIEQAIELASRRYGGPGGPNITGISETPGVVGSGTMEVLVQTGPGLPKDRLKTWYGVDRVRAGERAVPLSRYRALRREIDDLQEYWVRYLPRHESDELIRELELQGLLDRVNVKGLSTTLGGPRVAKPTTSQMQVRELLRERYAIKRRPGFEKSEPLMDLTQSARAHIRRTADAVKRSRFIQDVAGSWGVELAEGQAVPPGWVELGRSKGFTAGMERGLADKMRRTVVPEDVMTAVSQYDQVLTKQYKGALHSILQFEKQYLTIVNPQFTLRNQAWNVAVSWMRGNRSVSTWRDAMKALSGKFDSVRVPGMDYTYGELRRLALREGVVGPGLSQELEALPRVGLEPTLGQKIAQVGRQGAPSEALAVGGEATVRAAGTPVRALKAINQEGEATARLAHFIYGVRDKRMTLEQARVEVGRTLFNYQKDFYTIHEAGLREVIPFYAWYRRIFPLALRTSFENPGEYAKLGTLMNQMNALNGVDTNEMEFLGRAYMDALGIVLPDEPGQLPGTKRVLSLRGIGVVDPGGFLHEPRGRSESWMGWFQGPAQTVGEAVRPGLGAVISTVSGTSLGGQTFDARPTKLPQVMTLLPKEVLRRMNVEVVDGQPYGAAYWVPLFRYVGGSAGNALAAGLSDNPRARARWAAWASGVSIDPEVPVAGIERAKSAEDYYKLIDEVKGLRARGKLTGAAIVDSVLRDAAKSEEERRALEALKMLESLQAPGAE